MGLLVDLARIVVVSELESILIQEKKKKRLPKRRLRGPQRTAVMEEKAQQATQKNTFMGKAVTLVSLNKN
jgi:hypothetical protein